MRAVRVVARDPSGRGFRRQAVLGRFIVDFYAPGHRLVVVTCLRRPAFGGSGEVDGGVHDSLERRAHDAARQAELEASYGVCFVRVSAL